MMQWKSNSSSRGAPKMEKRDDRVLVDMFVGHY